MDFRAPSSGDGEGVGPGPGALQVQGAFTGVSGEAANEPLGRVAAAVAGAVAPLSVPADDYMTPPVAEYRFAAHLALASHEPAVDNRLSKEVGEFLAVSPCNRPPPSSHAGTHSSNSAPTGTATGGST
jgi:hypothetical protein